MILFSIYSGLSPYFSLCAPFMLLVEFKIIFVGETFSLWAFNFDILVLSSPIFVLQQKLSLHVFPKVVNISTLSQSFKSFYLYFVGTRYQLGASQFCFFSSFLPHHRIISFLVGLVSLNAQDKHILLKNEDLQSAKRILEQLHFSLKILNFQHLLVLAEKARQNYITLIYLFLFFQYNQLLQVLFLHHLVYYQQKV